MSNEHQSWEHPLPGTQSPGQDVKPYLEFQIMDPQPLQQVDASGASNMLPWSLGQPTYTFDDSFNCLNDGFGDSSNDNSFNPILDLQLRLALQENQLMAMGNQISRLEADLQSL